MLFLVIIFFFFGVTILSVASAALVSVFCLVLTSVL